MISVRHVPAYALLFASLFLLAAHNLWQTSRHNLGDTHAPLLSEKANAYRRSAGASVERVNELEREVHDLEQRISAVEKNNNNKGASGTGGGGGAFERRSQQQPAHARDGDKDTNDNPAVVPGHLPYDCDGEPNGFGITTDACHMERNAEYWGDVVKWGTENLKASPAACCQSCRDHGKCNVWVFCDQPNGCGSQKQGECWLKRLAHPSIARTSANRNPKGAVPWTSGALYESSASGSKSGFQDAKRKFHVLMTSNASPYVQWQGRVSYYHYKKLRDSHPNSAMGGFTRILHSGQEDQLMDEIPTVVVDQLRNDHGFVVLSRPYAFQQWVEKYASQVEEEYVLMSEPDHLFMRPLPNLMVGEEPAAFPFFYIDPPKFPELVRKYVRSDLSDAEIEAIDPIGNSPVMLSKRDLARIAKPWADVVVQMKTDPQADKAWGWVLEMWAYTLTAYKLGIKHHLYPELAAQPPWDTDLKDFYILHYTYGCDYTLDGVFTPGKVGAWRFDKRSYMGRAPPRNLALPPQNAPPLVHALIGMINEATSALNPWPL